MQIINAVISSIGMHGGVPLQDGTGNADNSTTVSNIQSTYLGRIVHARVRWD